MLRLTELWNLVKDLIEIIGSVVKARKKSGKITKAALSRIEDTIDAVITANQAVHQLSEDICKMLVMTYAYVAAYVNEPIVGKYLLEILEDEAHMLLENFHNVTR